MRREHKILRTNSALPLTEWLVSRIGTDKTCVVRREGGCAGTNKRDPAARLCCICVSLSR